MPVMLTQVLIILLLSNRRRGLFPVGHAMSIQQGILGHLLDFDETWCVCCTYELATLTNFDLMHHIVSDL